MGIAIEGTIPASPAVTFLICMLTALVGFDKPSSIPESNANAMTALPRPGLPHLVDAEGLDEKVVFVGRYRNHVEVREDTSLSLGAAKLS